MVWTIKKGRYMYPHPEYLNMLVISVSHGKQRHKRGGREQHTNRNK
jgi:hypothetical protein